VPADRRVLIACFVILCVSAGLNYYSLPVYLLHLTRDGLPLAAVSAGTSVSFLSGACSALLVGWVLRRVGPRPFLIAGGLLAAVALVAIGHTRSLPALYLAYGALGVAFMGCTMLPITTMVVQLFPQRRRASALALATLGNSMGGVLVAPVMAVLIDHSGLRTAGVVAGATLAGLVLVASTLILPARLRTARRHDPVERGTGAEQPAMYGLSLHAVFRSPTFYLLVGAFFLFQGMQVGSVTHLALVGQERGFAAPELLVSVTTGSAVLARLIATRALRKATVWGFSAVVFAVEALAMVLLAVSGPIAAVLIAGAALLGLAVGSTPLILPLTQVDAFGSKEFARFSPVVGIAAATGQALAPVVMSAIHDSAGNYLPACLLGAIAPMVGAGLLLGAGRVRGGPTVDSQQRATVGPEPV
jgi:predicted MFS family arabinose efflux permease